MSSFSGVFTGVSIFLACFSVCSLGVFRLVWPVSEMAIFFECFLGTVKSFGYLYGVSIFLVCFSGVIKLFWCIFVGISLCGECLG